VERLASLSLLVVAEAAEAAAEVVAVKVMKRNT